MKARYSESQIIGILKQAEGGVSVGELCREPNAKRLTKGPLEKSSQARLSQDHSEAGCGRKENQHSFILSHVWHEWLEMHELRSIEDAQEETTKSLWTYVLIWQSVALLQR